MAVIALPDCEANADFAPLHTLGLRSRVAQLLRLTDTSDLTTDWMARLPQPVRVLGSGSNLVPAERIEGTVLKLETQGKTLVDEDADAYYVQAAGGEQWHDLVCWTLAQGWPGLENLSLIPGTVGAAPVQNIGAYGLELKDVFHSLTAFSLRNGSIRRFNASECAFAYRNSIFKQREAARWLILDLTLRLPKQWQARIDYGALRARLEQGAVTPAAVAATVIAERQSKLPDPALLGNAGSFFHNPQVSAAEATALQARYPTLPCYPQPDGRVKLAAGWLIEQVGWRGKRLGPVGMYDKQALVLVNHGGASANDVWALAHAVQEAVEQQFGVALQPEPDVWGGA